MRAVMLLTLLAASCELDNTLSGKEEDEGSFDTGDDFEPPFETGKDPDETGETGGFENTADQCDSQTFTGFAVAQLEECYSAAPEAGTFTPVVEWEAQTFSTDSGSSSCMMQPIVCSMNDDDGDGAADDEDTPDVLLITFAWSSGVPR